MAIEYKVTGVVDFKDGRTVPLEDVTAEDMRSLLKDWGERASRTVSRHCKAYPEDYKNIPDIRESRT